MSDDRWLKIADAAKELGVSVDTVKRYISRDGLRVMHGRVVKSEAAEAEKAARDRRAAGLKVGAVPAPSRLHDLAEAYCADLDAASAVVVLGFVAHIEKAA